jgi:hypothetical protein
MNIAKNSLNKLDFYCRNEAWQGYDPYDALNSPILRTLAFEKKYLRIAFIQALKRLPFNVRSCFRIKKGYNPKGIGLFLWGYAKLYELDRQSDHLEMVDFFLKLLKELKSPGYSGNCWGYNFDWQSRAFYLPRFTPTVVNSAFIGHALIDTYQYTKKDQALEMALSIKDFVLNDLNQTKEGTAICFSYSPLDQIQVHNANFLGASFLIRIFKYINEEKIKETALSSLSFGFRHQRADGSWHYGEGPSRDWIDSFHTGFNLQSISYFFDEDLGQEYRSGFEKGLEFYQKNFFLEDGTPKYYHDQTYPLDIHAAAEAIVVFSRLGLRYRDMKEKVAAWMIDHLQDEGGFFYFQKHKWYVNRIPYIRWSQAWAFHALSSYLISDAQQAN